MNYRHIYHAGNICDVVKHAALAVLCDQLRGKDAAFLILDTHAGAGLYDLADPRALKTGEAQAGIFRMLTAAPAPELDVYFNVLQTLNPNWQKGSKENFRFYPGSPLLAARMLRAQDRLIACELHEEDVRGLRHNMSNFKLAHVHSRDGYEALRAFLPPAEKRGLVLIDPPYEVADEFRHLGEAVIEAHKRWPQGIFMIWYPVKERPAVWRFHETLIASDIKKMLCAEFVYEEEISAERLNGCGLIIINPPWKTDEKLRKLFSLLHGAMKTPHRGGEIKWLATE